MSLAIDPAVLGNSALLVLVYMSAWFAVSLIVRRADIADIAWGLGFIAIGVWLLARDDAPGTLRQYLVTVLVAVWGLRLAWHVAKRSLRPGHGEDRRYAQWRRDWGRWFVLRSYLQVFLLQGVFMLVVSAPLLVAGSALVPESGVFEVMGILIWIGGFVFESVGDAQLARFLRDRSNAGRVMDRGLWSLTRHPNYFGESMMWWGLAIMCLGIEGGWIALAGPATITWLLVRVSGVPMLEAHMSGKPGWEAYKAKTSVFVPLPRRKG